MSPATNRLFLSSVFKRAKELKLKPSQRLVLTALFKYLGRKDFCWPTQRMLAEDTGLCTRQIRRILEKLASVGVIERDKRRTTGRACGNNAYEYRLALSQSSETKADISDQTKADICDSQSGHLKHSKADICDSQSGHLRHSKVPEKQASSERAGAEYISNISINQSINQSAKNDGLMTDEKIKEKIPREKTASKDVDSLAWNEEDVSPMETENGNFEPPPGAPPRLTSEKIKGIFGGPAPRPVNLLDCPERDIDLSGLVASFKKEVEVFLETIGFNPDIPQAEWFEKALKEFFEQVIKIHWNRKSKPPGAPFRRLFYRAGRSGLLYAYGFHPLNPEQQEERRRELERQEEEAAEAARIEEEERCRLAEKRAKFREFINRLIVRDYLSFMGFPPRDHGGIKDHLREIAARLNGRATLTAVEKFMREKLQKEGY